MTYQIVSAPAETMIREIAATRGVLGKIGRGISAFFGTLAEFSATTNRMKQVQALQAKTDEELATMKLKREDIVSYVFRDVLYI